MRRARSAGLLLALFATSSLLPTILTTPLPQSDEESTVTKAKAEDEDDGDFGTVAGDLLGGFFDFVGGAVKTISDLASDGEVHETVGSVVDSGLKSATEVVKAGSAITRQATAVHGSATNLFTGLAKTVQETGGFLEGKTDEISQGLQLFGIVAEAYANQTSQDLQGFLKIFNKRLKCNTECASKSLGTTDRKSCEKKYCEGFVPPKSKAEKEAEKQSFVEMYDYGYDEDEDEEYREPKA